MQQHTAVYRSTLPTYHRTSWHAVTTSRRSAYNPGEFSGHSVNAGGDPGLGALTPSRLGDSEPLSRRQGRLCRRSRCRSESRFRNSLNKMRRSVIWLLSSSLSKCAFRTGCSSKVPAVRIFKWSVAWLVFNNRIIYSGPIDLCTFLSNERRLGGISGVTALFWRFIDWGYQPPASSGSVPVHIWLKVFEIWDELPQETIHTRAGGSNFEFQRGKMAMRVK